MVRDSLIKETSFNRNDKRLPKAANALGKIKALALLRVKQGDLENPGDLLAFEEEKSKEQHLHGTKIISFHTVFV